MLMPVSTSIISLFFCTRGLKETLSLQIKKHFLLSASCVFCGPVVLLHSVRSLAAPHIVFSRLNLLMVSLKAVCDMKLAQRLLLKSFVAKRLCGI